jgi:tetratricopeptide (TPR) repeat protein
MPALMRRALVACILLLAACRPRETAAPPLSAPHAPVILISIDTLRADRVGAGTPHIESLRKDGILYTSAWSHAPLTLPSHISILTGLLPPDHGVRNNIGFSFDPARHPTIASILKERGYATGAAVSAYVLRGNTGLEQAFDFYDDDIAVQSGEAVGRLQRPGAETERVAETWITARGQQPFFFMLHLFEPHTPYEPAYDADVAAADAITGRFIDFLKRSGIYDRALIILLSDHGEGLGDHGEDEHGIFLYREAIHVPLIVKLPGSQRSGETIDAPVALVDVLPTVAAITGAPVKGTSLLAPAPTRRIYSETLYPRIHLGWSDLRSFVDAGYHFIDAPRPELFATTDRQERQNIIDENRRVAAAMRKDLEPFSREMPALGNIDPEDAKKLAALGYLSAPASASGGALPDPKDRIGDLNLLKEANRLEHSGRPNDAIALYRQVIDRNPRLTDAWTLLGQTYERTGRLQDAADMYKRAIQLAPSLAGEFSLSLGNVYLMLNKPDEASSHAQLGMKSNPGNAHIIIGRAALAKNDLATAGREAESAGTFFGYAAPAAVLRAQVLGRQGRLQEALATVDKVRGAAVPLLHFVRGDILARLNRVDEAIAAFNEEIRLYPHDRQAYANLTVVYTLLDRRADANATMEKLVKANPSPDSYELAAKTFEEMGDRQTAAAWRRRRR